MSNLMTDTHPHLQLPPTHDGGSQPINSAFGTEELRASAAAYLAKGCSPRDHHAMVVGLLLSWVMGRGPPKIEPIQTQSLTGRIPTSQRNYLIRLTTNLKGRGFLCLCMHFGATISSLGPEEEHFLNQWDRDKIRAMCHAEKKSHQLQMGNTPFSWKMNGMGCHTCLWKQVIAKKTGWMMSLLYIKCLAKKAGVQAPLSILFPEAFQLLDAAEADYQFHKPFARK